MGNHDFETVFLRLTQFPGVELGRGATEAEIAEAETQLELPLAASYREFLRRFGWARIVREEFLGLGADVPPQMDLLKITQRERNKSQPRLRKDFIPLRHDGEGNFDCIYTGARRGLQNPIVLWEREEGPQQIPGQIATSFPDWLSQRLDELAEES